MPRRFRRGFRRGGMRRAKSFVRRIVSKMGPVEAKRVMVEALAIPNYTTSSYDNPLDIGLLECVETMNEETVSDGSNIADAQLYSKLVGLKLDIKIRGSVTSPPTLRWMLVKWEDGEELTTALTDGFFHSSNDSPTGRELRKLTLAKGFVLLNESSGTTRLNVFVRRSTLKRLGSLRENDRIVLVVATGVTQPATTPKINIMGTLYVRMN